MGTFGLMARPGGLQHKIPPDAQIFVRGSRIANKGSRHVRHRALGTEAKRLRNVSPKHASFLESVERQPALVVHLLIG